jgi:hypothetical protein
MPARGWRLRRPATGGRNPCFPAFAAAAVLAVAPTPAQPIVVADRPIALTTIQRNAQTLVDDRRDLPGTYEEIADDVRAADEATEAAWIAGEAAARGLSADPKLVDAALAREKRVHGSDYASLLGPETAGEARARVAGDVLRETVGAALAGSAGASFARTFDAFHARWRAATQCLPHWRYALQDRCGNLRHPHDSCVWMGEADVCAAGGAFLIEHDLAAALYPARRPGARADAAAVALLRRSVPRAVLRRVRILTADGLEQVHGHRRADLVTVAQVLQRLAWRAQRSAAGQAIR